MKEIQLTYYVCEICNQQYIEKKQAEECEARAVVSSGIKIGDVVEILSGACLGELAIVEEVVACKRDYFEHTPDLYWHKERIVAKVINSWGYRAGTSDAFKKVEVLK